MRGRSVGPSVGRHVVWSVGKLNLCGDLEAVGNSVDITAMTRIRHSGRKIEVALGRSTFVFVSAKKEGSFLPLSVVYFSFSATRNDNDDGDVCLRLSTHQFIVCLTVGGGNVQTSTRFLYFCLLCVLFLSFPFLLQSQY